MEQKKLQLWQTWLQPIEIDNPVGIDPSYEDSFQDIKNEIDKLSGIDAAMIVEKSAALFCFSAKDIRVLAYYIWGRFKQEGISGLFESLDLLMTAIEYYGDAILPKRVKSRKLSLEWLNSSKFIELFENSCLLTHQEKNELIASLQAVEKSTQIWPVAGRPSFTPLINFLNRFEQNFEQQTASNTTLKVRESRDEESAVILSETITSTRDVIDQVRTLAQFLRQKPNNFLLAMHLLRVTRWDNLVDLPPHNTQFQTRLDAPRAETRNHLRRLWQQKSWQELLEQTEKVFMESANHFWLDLQKYACIALQQSHTSLAMPEHAYPTIVTELTSLLQRLPSIEELRFSDNTPFADEDTKHWLREKIQDVQPNVAKYLQYEFKKERDELDWNKMEQQALALAQSKSLAAAFEWLQNQSDIVTEKQRYFQRYLLAKIAEKMGNIEIAQQLLEPLDQQLSQLTLLHWENDLAFAIKARLVTLLQNKIALKGSDTQLSNEQQQVIQLQKELMNLDPVRAVLIN